MDQPLNNEIELEDSPNVPFRIPVIVTHKNDKPCIELRRQNINNTETIKIILSAIMHGKPITIYPVFTDIHKSIATLIEKGVIYYNKDTKEYYYTL